ncbi:MAG: 1,5-anhydro-D-fructose reductase [bacterium]|nr:1,5-anhydro-D-fructose reductase [bacterium]
MHTLLVIGAGSIGERHARCLLATGRAEVGICETDPERLREVAERYHLGTGWTSLEEALAEAWDAAVVATPAHRHVRQALVLAERGIHLLIEKPLSTSFEGVSELALAIRDRRVKASMAYVYRAHPGAQRFRQLLMAGALGRPVELLVTSGQHFPTYRPAYREIYYARRETGGGAVQDALTHLINLGEWLLGPLTRVAADTARLGLEGVEVEDTVHVLARHGDLLAAYTLNQHQAPNETTVTVNCERGTLRWELHSNRIRKMTRNGPSWEDEHLPPLERDEWFICQENAFLELLEGKRPPLCTLAEGAQTLAATLAILESADRGEWVEIQPFNP